MARSTDVTSTDFPKMGESMEHVLNLSGERSPYTKSTPRKTMGRGSSPTGTAAIRGRTMIKEANGPCFHIKATLYSQNAAEASAVTRNVRIMPSAVGNRDFWSKRQYGQGV